MMVRSARNLVIGDEECTIDKVSYMMAKCTGAEILHEKWPELAVKLGTPRPEIDLLKANRITNLTETAELLVHLLTKFRSSRPHRAQLGTLIDILKSMDLKLMAKKLEEHFQNRITLSSTHHSSVDTLETCSLMESQPNSQTSSIENIYDNTREKNPNILFTELVFKVALLLLFFATFIIVGLVFWNTLKSHSLENSSSIDTSGDEFLGDEKSDPQPSHYDAYADDTHINVSVTTYKEYISIFTNNKLHGNSTRDIILHISLNQSTDWSQNSKLLNAHLIKILVLEGSFSLSTFLHLLSQTVKLKELRIINSSNLFCNNLWNREPDREKGSINSVGRYGLEKLALYNFTTCTETYDVILNAFPLQSLRDLKIVGGVFDDTNILSIQKILSIARETLQHIYLDGSKFTSKYFDDPSQPLASVTRIKLNLNSNRATNSANTFTIDRHFHKTFENLEYLKCKESISYSEFIHILQHPKLRDLIVNVSMERNQYNWDFTTFYTGSNLVYLDLGLLFDPTNCPKSNNIDRMGIDKLKKKVKKLCIGSNCSILFRKGISANVQGDGVKYLRSCSINKG